MTTGRINQVASIGHSPVITCTSPFAVKIAPWRLLSRSTCRG